MEFFSLPETGSPAQKANGANSALNKAAHTRMGCASFIVPLSHWLETRLGRSPGDLCGATFYSPFDASRNTQYLQVHASGKIGP
jgi:hypothetical protein